MSTNINVYIFILLAYILLNLKFLSNKLLNLLILGIFHDKLISQICFQTTQRRPRKIKTNFKKLKIFYFFIYLSFYVSTSQVLCDCDRDQARNHAAGENDPAKVDIREAQV